MFKLEGKVTDLRIDPKIKVIGFGKIYEKLGLKIEIIHPWTRKYIFASIPLDYIQNNPLEEKRLQNELKGKKVLYEKESSYEGKEFSFLQRQTLIVMSGKLKGLRLEYLGNLVDND
ncbi:hypothetical protein M0R72_04435 [Candidatus Pacearchaeota archaeon]|jgi:hypothetical protein|nr:hypothetical protein [Candidatus Pacearchaeota archaeon]